MIAVTGDVWIDYVGFGSTRARRRAEEPEPRTFILPGGALLLQKLIEAAVSADVAGPLFWWPAKLVKPRRAKLITWDELQKIAGHLTPEEMPRSLLSLMPFAETLGPNTNGSRIRVDKALGFAGGPWPELPVEPPASRGAANFVVLDDTYGQFRAEDHQKGWPVEIRTPASPRPTVIHKLRGPFPSRQPEGLWKAASADPEQHIVIVSADDLRQEDISISRGLSWERTVLDVVWHLLRHKEFETLRSCRHLIVRLGIDGAIYWQSAGLDGPYEASLIYDPAGIEGNTEQRFNGKMVGYGSAFVAGVVKWVVERKGTAGIPKGIRAGLVAARRLLRSGFGDGTEAPSYPATNDLFANVDRVPGESEEDRYFPRSKIPGLSETVDVDPGYWRLLESVFAEGQPDAVAVEDRQVAAAAKVAIGQKPHHVDVLRDAPLAAFCDFRSYDRREIEQYRALYSLMRDYVSAPRVHRPLNVAVFGPPGAGKSFGITELAKALHESGVRDLAGESSPRKIVPLTFNLSQYNDPTELTAAFHQVRDCALRDEVPLVFFDEFDSTVSSTPLGWLRYFLSPMQDGKFFDGGLEHPIGRAVFVFAGGTAASYDDFEKRMTSGDPTERDKFCEAKGPDFLSRLRAVLDIHGLDLDPDFDAYGRVENFPCEAAIRLRRAHTLAFLGGKRPQLRDGDKIHISPVVVDALLRVRQFYNGNRSFEALFDSSHLNDAREFYPSSLASPDHVELYTDAGELERLLMKADIFAEVSEKMDAAISDAHFVETACGAYQMNARDVLRILQREECIFARISEGANVSGFSGRDTILLSCAERAHNRWVADKRREGIVFRVIDASIDAPSELIQSWLVPWAALSGAAQEHYRRRFFAIPEFLKKAGYVIIGSSSADWIASQQKALQRNRRANRPRHRTT